MATTQRYDKIQESQNQEYIALNLITVAIFEILQDLVKPDSHNLNYPSDKNTLTLINVHLYFQGIFPASFVQLKECVVENLG